MDKRIAPCCYSIIESCGCEGADRSIGIGELMTWHDNLNPNGLRFDLTVNTPLGAYPIRYVKRKAGVQWTDVEWLGRSITWIGTRRNEGWIDISSSNRYMGKVT